jgi:hypothetical protein
MLARDHDAGVAARDVHFVEPHGGCRIAADEIVAGFECVAACGTHEPMHAVGIACGRRARRVGQRRVEGVADAMRRLDERRLPIAIA